MGLSYFRRLNFSVEYRDFSASKMSDFSMAFMAPVRNGRRRVFGQVVVVFVGYIIALQISSGFCGWPEGYYGIPAHKGGCPTAGGEQWKIGSRLHQTEPRSHSSPGNHLLGQTDGFSDRILQTFCMKTSFGGDKNYYFMRGRYCIFKSNWCPARFQEGSIYWDDGGPLLPFTKNIQNVTDIRPDGKYGRNTRIDYCCRTDGVAHESIVLPSSEPFYLLKYGDTCQQVGNMDVTEEWIHWAGESSFNTDSQHGSYPSIERDRYPHTYTKVFYCYYTPKAYTPVSQNSWFEAFLMVVYVIGATVGIVFLVAVIVASIQRALMFRREHSQQRQWQNSTTRRREDAGRRLDSTAPSGRGSSPPDYSSCKVQSVAHNRNVDAVKEAKNGKATPVRSVPADDRSSVDSLNLLPDADSEAPPSYEEVLRAGNIA